MPHLTQRGQKHFHTEKGYRHFHFQKDMRLSLSGGSYSRNSAGWYEISWHSHTWPPSEWLLASSPWFPPAGGRSRSQIARSGYVNTLQSVWMGVSPVHCRVGKKYRSVSLWSVTCLSPYYPQPSLPVHCLFKVFTRFSLDFLSFPRFSTDLLFSTYFFFVKIFLFPTD